MLDFFFSLLSKSDHQNLHFNEAELYEYFFTDHTLKNKMQMQFKTTFLCLLKHFK